MFIKLLSGTSYNSQVASHTPPPILTLTKHSIFHLTQILQCRTLSLFGNSFMESVAAPEKINSISGFVQPIWSLGSQFLVVGTITTKTSKSEESVRFQVTLNQACHWIPFIKISSSSYSCSSSFIYTVMSCDIIIIFETPSSLLLFEINCGQLFVNPPPRFFILARIMVAFWMTNNMISTRYENTFLT